MFLPDTPNVSDNPMHEQVKGDIKALKRIRRCLNDPKAEHSRASLVATELSVTYVRSVHGLPVPKKIKYSGNMYRDSVKIHELLEDTLLKLTGGQAVETGLLPGHRLAYMMDINDAHIGIVHDIPGLTHIMGPHERALGDRRPIIGGLRKFYRPINPGEALTADILREEAVEEFKRRILDSISHLATPEGDRFSGQRHAILDPMTSEVRAIKTNGCAVSAKQGVIYYDAATIWTDDNHFHIYLDEEAK